MLRVAIARVSMSSSPGAAHDAMPAWLGDAERRRWATLPAPARAGFAASRALLRELLQQATGIAAASWEVSADAGTAPQASAEGSARGVQVSLSHRLGWVAAAVADTGVGVDIEVDRPARSDPGERAALMLAPAELADWRVVPDTAREAALLARWTAKEAWFKARPPQSAPWDFRRVHARACAPAQANARTWRAPPVHVTLACADARALADVGCAGLPPAAGEAFWHVDAL